MSLERSTPLWAFGLVITSLVVGSWSAESSSYGEEPPSESQTSMDSKEGAPNSGLGKLSFPVRIPLRYEYDRSLGLRAMRSSCCFEDGPLGRALPRPASEIPDRIGISRRFAVVSPGDAEIVLAVETLGNLGTMQAHRLPLLLRADTNLNGDLGDDPVIRCRMEVACGPFEARLPVEHGEIPYSFYVKLGGLSVEHSTGTKVGPAGAWIGVLGGVRFAIVDDDFNGSYDDVGDLLAFDLDSNGSFEAAFPRWQILPMGESSPWKDSPVRLARVDPVSATATFEWAPWTWLVAEVVEEKSGTAIAGAEVVVFPGGYSGRSGADGLAKIVVPHGQIDHLTVRADGYLGAVAGPRQRDRLDLGMKDDAGFRVLLRPGPCDSSVHRWCGSTTLDSDRSDLRRLDLETGILVDPKKGLQRGESDLSWRRTSSGWRLFFLYGARAIRLEDADFAEISRDKLHMLFTVPAGLTERFLDARKRCRKRHRQDGLLGPGTVLGFQTNEGRLGQLEIEECSQNLEIRWLVYKSFEDLYPPDDPG